MKSFPRSPQHLLGMRHPPLSRRRYPGSSSRQGIDPVHPARTAAETDSTTSSGSRSSMSRVLPDSFTPRDIASCSARTHAVKSETVVRRRLCGNPTQRDDDTVWAIVGWSWPIWATTAGLSGRPRSATTPTVSRPGLIETSVARIERSTTKSMGADSTNSGASSED